MLTFYLYLSALNCLVGFFQLLTISYIINELFGGRLDIRKVIILAIYGIIYGANTFLIYNIVEMYTWQFNMIVDINGNLLMLLFLLFLLYPARKKEILCLWTPLMMYMAVWLFLLQSLSTVLEEQILVKLIVVEQLELEIRLFILAVWNIIFYSLMLLLTIITFKLLIKTKLIIYLKILLDFPRLCIFWLVLYVGVSIYSYFASDTLSYFMLTLVIAAAIFICMLTARDFVYKEKIKQSEALILQQEGYVKRLENIQQELRMIQHDYKNMISSLYAQASDGDADSIKDFIETKLMGVDAAVQENINQMNQVSKIELPRLKGLVLAKMIQAEQKGVLLKLEVMNSVSEAAMDKNDLLRCIGILLDNAIEAAEYQDKSEVTLVLLSEPDKLTAAVKNPIQKKPDLSKIWQTGYSTKGENRGLGLTSYKKILNKYANVSCDTRATDNTFLQVLMITKVKNDKK